MSKLSLITSFLCLLLVAPFLVKSADIVYKLSSPDKKIILTFGLTNKSPWYSIRRNGEMVLEKSKLGLIRTDENFYERMSLVSVTSPSIVKDSYQLLTSKRKLNSYNASKRIVHLRNASGKLMNIIFQLSNDGLAFRYYFPGKSTDLKHITSELTSFNFGTDTKGWLQPMSDAKSGWALANPSYEEFYQQGIAVGTPSPIKAGWVYPALFNSGKNWILISETFPQGNYCGTRLKAESPEGEYSVGFPQESEAFPNGPVYPESMLPWYSPWRVVAIGTLKTIVESSLGTDVAPPSIQKNSAIVIPGKSSWSWVLMGDRATNYAVQKQFIDYAADMKWKYCLIDALWDKQIGYEKMRELADYAQTKNVSLLLWYNSAGSWNETPQTPKSKLLTHEDRMKEFGIIKAMGIKGVKIDFFGGDGQSMMNYYTDILKDALQVGLLVNFHGCTLPRGLQRTYPNLVSMEAIKGMEFATFEQLNTDVQPVHCTTIPFTRNVFDPMDYTPMALYRMPGKIRRTSSAFELALPVIFQSGIQHLAETPDGMSRVPVFVKTFLQELPDSWDDIRFIDGFPGKLTVLARRSGKTWIVAGINGESTSKTISLNLSFLQKHPAGKLITDGTEPGTFTESVLTASAKSPVTLKPNGGFVLVFK